MIKERSQAICRSRWFTPLICVAAGIVMFAVSWLGGQFAGGLISFAILAAFGLVILLLTGRSETVRGLTVGRDERFAQLDLRATAVSGMVVLLAALVPGWSRPPAVRAGARTAGSWLSAGSPT